MKSSSQIPAISNITDQLVQNPKGINSNNIIFKLDQQFMKHLSITYQEQKFFFTNLLGLHETHEERTERLFVHSYNIRIAERRTDRSMQNTKLINLIEGNLHSTKNYISVIQLITNIPELCAYLENNILIIPMNYPEQKNIRHAIINRITNGERSDISSQILN